MYRKCFTLLMYSSKVYTRFIRFGYLYKKLVSKRTESANLPKEFRD